MKSLVIIGAGGFGREVLVWARQATEAFEVRGFIDDDLQALGRFQKDVPILGRVRDYVPKSDDFFVCAMGRVDYKRRCIETIRERGGVFTQLIHKTAVIGEDVHLGEGVILCPYSIVSSDAFLSDFVTVNLHSSVAHDSSVGRWTQLHCHVDVTGSVTVGDRVTIGSHASLLPGVTVGSDATIGAGSVVLRDIAAGTTVCGVPARPLIVRDVAAV